MKARLLRYRSQIIFLAVYTLGFLLLSRLAAYVMPFLIAPVIAVVMKPLYDFLRRRFNFRSTFAATVITLMVFGAVFAALGFLLYLVIRQAYSLFESYGYLLVEVMDSRSLYEQLQGALMSGSLMGTVSDVAGAMFRLVPLAIIFIVITFALTVWLLHHMGDLKTLVLNRVGESRREKTAAVIANAYLLARRFIRSYLILYLITFLEAAYIFTLTGVDYPLPFAFLTAVADILPILGPGVVLVPFGVVFILQGNYFAGVSFLVFFILTGILRQIMEPKLVSDTVKLHPLIVMTGIYLSVAAMNLWILFYVLTLTLIGKVLKMSGVISSEE